jgi:hypothetical protein
MEQMLFLNVSWMARYQGLAKDQISGGFGYVKHHGYGDEIFNFKPYRGHMYGFGNPPRRSKKKGGSIKIERLGAPKGEPSVDKVLVIWVAKSKIIGWYKNATVFRKVRPPPEESRRIFKRKSIGYNVSALRQDCKLLPPDSRLIHVPRAKERKHAMGRYVWYADGTVNRPFRNRVLKYVDAGGNPSVFGNGRRTKKAGPPHHGTPHQPDPHKRERVERCAVDLTDEHFDDLGYNVRSVEVDNKGWDLEAVHRQTGVLLRLEVKGLSGSSVTVEMTPQEYKMMRSHRQSYRVCVVTNSLAKKQRALSVFACNDTSGAWIDGNDRPLVIQEMKSARLRAY